ncbi:MAG: hypothetical protein FJ297_04135 [Planctomycetes bacterium]|nr:hypothetical protein [Planctomycetota bacterium]
MLRQPVRREGLPRQPLLGLEVLGWFVGASLPWFVLGLVQRQGRLVPRQPLFGKLPRRLAGSPAQPLQRKLLGQLRWRQGG